MVHRMLSNASGKPMKHPTTGQVIMPGQLYAEPDEKTAKEQEVMLKTAQKLAKAATKKQKEDSEAQTGGEESSDDGNAGGEKSDGEASGGDH
ncbi:MAG: hypothetical protein M1609_06490 [Firmicutes bacterium]|nr:hypothetical protein [Bacillota bacterium]